MFYKIILFSFITSGVVVNSFRVSINGQVSMAKGVLRILNDYLEYLVNPTLKDGRRSLSDLNVTFTRDAIKAAKLCEHAPFCKEKHKSFLDDYLIDMSSAVEKNFDVFIAKHRQNFKGRRQLYPKIYNSNNNHTQDFLEVIKTIFNEADITHSDSWVWVDTLKKINILFQEDALLYFNANFEGDAATLAKLNNNLFYTLTPVLSLVEATTENRICREFQLCLVYLYCSRALNTFFGIFEKLTKDQAQKFMEFFYSQLSNTKFYSLLDDATVNAFQLVLSDMAFTYKPQVKYIMMHVAKVVENRLLILNGTDVALLPYGPETMLMNAIVSDMDHFYSRSDRLRGPFLKFIDDFRFWANGGEANLNEIIREIMQDIIKELALKPEKLLAKLEREVVAFLVLSLEPEPL